MNTNTNQTDTLLRILGFYGANPSIGLLTDHIDIFTAAGGTIRAAASGSGASWAVVAGKAYPVVCGDLIEVWTEDGRSDGRCGLPTTREGACETHALQREEWLGMAETEKAAWERLADSYSH